MKRAGRLHAPELTVLIAHTYGHPRGDRPIIELRAPSPGVFVPWIAQGDLVSPGAVIGELAVLGRISALVVPRTAGEAAAAGIALELPPATHAVGYADLLVALDPSLQRAAGARGEASSAVQATALGLVFRAPTSGRFYGRSTPDKPPFVAEGTQLTAGTTICLLEVMKTFHRVTYGGPGLPETAQVRRVLVADGDDVNAGDPLLALA
jgi:acetyl-CoA carboxylase biotin carboxyl carrier protein